MAVCITKEKFNIYYNQITESTQTLSQTLKSYIERRKWNWLTFQNHTYESKDTFKRIMRGEYNTPSLKKVLAISIGLKLSTLERQQIMTKAGYTWTNSRTHAVYQFILDSRNAQTLTVPDFNADCLRLDLGEKDLLGILWQEDVAEFNQVS